MCASRGGLLKRRHAFACDAAFFVCVCVCVCVDLCLWKCILIIRQRPAAKTKVPTPPGFVPVEMYPDYLPKTGGKQKDSNVIWTCLCGTASRIFAKNVAKTEIQRHLGKSFWKCNDQICPNLMQRKTLRLRCVTLRTLN